MLCYVLYLAPLCWSILDATVFMFEEGSWVDALGNKYLVVSCHSSLFLKVESMCGNFLWIHVCGLFAYAVDLMSKLMGYG